VVLFAAALDVAHAGPRDSCTVQPQSSAGFDSLHSHRPENRGSRLLHRDLEFHLDATYSGAITLELEATLTQFARTLDEYVGFSPVAQDANGYQATYDYFRRAGADWNPIDPWDTTSVRLGLSEATTLKPEDRAHADLYIFRRSRGLSQDGQWPSAFFANAEDVTSWRAAGDLRHDNSMMIKGPADAEILDPAGIGWTCPREPYQTLFYYELQHSLLPEEGQGSDRITELWSAAAEAVAGQYDYPRFDFSYTANMLGNYLSWSRDAVALTGVASERVRLLAEDGTVLFGVKRLLWETGGATAPGSTFDPLGDGPGGRDLALTVEDGQGVTVDADHPLAVRFDVPPLAAGASRTAFLELTAKRLPAEATARAELVEREPTSEPAFAIVSVRPNPAVGRASMAITLPMRMRVRATIHDLQGARVRTLADESKEAGSHTLVWDGRDERGAHVRAGTYFVRLASEAGTLNRRFVYLR